VAYEKPDLEAERKQLVIDTSNNKQILKELEDQLLDELSKETDIPLVDNDPLIAVLDDAKTKSVMISEALENAKITNENIDQQRENYKSCAKRGAILFFAMSGLSAISSMYEYSLLAFLVVFNNALK
jgi:dynein heavy chain